MIVVHYINKRQEKKIWSHLDVFSLCYVLLKKVAPIAPIAPIAPLSREYVRETLEKSAPIRKKQLQLTNQQEWNAY